MFTTVVPMEILHTSMKVTQIDYGILQSTYVLLNCTLKISRINYAQLFFHKSMLALIQQYSTILIIVSEND